MICHWTLEIICFEMQMDRLDKSESFLACHINYLIIWPLIHHPFFTGKVYKVAFFLFQLQLFSHLWDLSVVPEPGGPGGPLAPPQYFADQLTLFKPGRADFPHLLLLAPPMFFTFRHHWLVITYYQVGNTPLYQC